MTVTLLPVADALHRLHAFDTIVDARSPAEYAEDHLPGAENWPVLDDDERRAVGTDYARSPFEARKRGAALVARRVSEHLAARVADKPRDWQPLVYCWRGGKRSGTLAWFLGEIGFRTQVLQGGYKAFRAAVLAELAELPARFAELRVVCGRTGSGKTRLLGALAAAGAQVLDLEALAQHRGSVLGALPDRPQPSQKAFDTRVWHALARLDPARPLYVESESRKVGNLQVPPALVERMRAHGRCLVVDMPDTARVELLLDEYRHFIDDVEGFCRRLDALVELRGRDSVRRWQALARDGRWPDVFGALMREHYDPIYERSMRANFLGFAVAAHIALRDASPAALAAAASAAGS